MSSLAERLANLKKTLPDVSAETSAGSGDSLGSRDSARVRRLKAIEKNRNSAAGRAESGRTFSVPPGTEWKQQGTNLWVRRIKYPSVIPAGFDTPLVLPYIKDPGGMIFYDLETTGLSGGSGNIAFLIGAGRQEKDFFYVTQFFISDYPGEPEMLQAYSSYIGSTVTDASDEKSGELFHVSFNGKSFDYQILKTRYLMNRLNSPAGRQIDLLYPSRRIWGRLLSDSRLATLEENVLGVVRTDDLPGSEAPEAWFRWLKGQSCNLEGVFKHNADDVYSLALLLAEMAKCGKTAGSEITALKGIQPSPYGMALQWEASPAPGASVHSRKWLEYGAARGDKDCILKLAYYFKKEKNYPPAAELWQGILEKEHDYFCAVELSKYYEHRLRDYPRAAAVLKNIDRTALSPSEAEALEHRESRLKRY
jgi:uncharacterized protein YprB with RNaseH-like and TPR domain